MFDLENYQRYQRDDRNPFRRGVLLIDHISLVLSPLQEEQYRQYQEENYFLPNEDIFYRKPHITLAYSPVAIQDFPELPDIEGTIEQPFYSPLTLNNTDFDGWEVFTDPYGTRHLILNIQSQAILDMYNYYKLKGAVWPSKLGYYKPFMMILSRLPESVGVEHCTNIQSLPPAGLTFDRIRYTRFGDVSLT